MRIKLKKRLKGYKGDFTLDVDISVKKGCFITIFGRSGAGKTTLLKMLAGLLKPDEGFIEVGEEIWYDSNKGINLPPQKRKVGVVFQDYALFPNMTVEENILYGMEKKDKELLEKLLILTQLTKLRNRKPQSLSGGQKQRVALARAVARKPDILLLDEPLSALDIDMRRKLQEELFKIHRTFSLTTFLISHDFSEVFRLSDRVFVMENGKIIKEGKPDQIFVQERLSGKVKFSGEILQIKKEDVVYIVSVLVGNNIIKVVADPEEIQDLSVGDKVVVASKAFNPFILKSE
ncbi:ATP-binding cassette domain-containing protein [Persephonella sp.]|uniref:ABC transporter ATP-binding protein n=1 Tax=Persephonella sp. TaxID=2060922 RepID=UPI0025DA8EC4|nr:ATP-binding cassette domain-containing protein [Persephonella sp.]